MALINRITRLFKADFHAVLDQIEEPEQLLKQAIREMEDELADAERNIRLRAHEQATLETRRVEQEDALRELDEELDLCFSSGKDDLARSLVRRKLEVKRVVLALRARHDENSRFLSEQEAGLKDNRATLDSLKQKAEIFAQRTPGAGQATDTGDLSWQVRELQINEAEVEIAFLREQDRRTAS